jgi:hypothetical protein
MQKFAMHFELMFYNIMESVLSVCKLMVKTENMGSEISVYFLLSFFQGLSGYQGQPGIPGYAGPPGFQVSN